jgi:putative chitinase
MFIPTLTQFQNAAGISPSLAARWYDVLVAAMHEFGIDTPLRVAGFIAQIYVESSGFTRLTENLNYTPQGLVATFTRRISQQQANEWGRRPGEKVVPHERQVKIANQVYSNRFGNRGPESGDGWRYRGQGLKQLTFADNYRDCGAGIGLDLLNHPEYLRRDAPAARSAGWYWQSCNCNRYADAGDLRGMSRAINGGDNGLAQRQQAYTRARRILCL